MIQTIRVTNHAGDSVLMELTNPYETGFLIRSITGIGPMKATINTTELATMDGALYNSSRATARNIVFSLGFLNQNKTIEEIRMDSYRYFPVKRPISIIVQTDSRMAEITGYVESNEPDIFSESEGCQISVICPDPYFHALEVNKTVFSGVDPKFEFPFENNSPTEKLINFGDIHLRQDCVIHNDGDEEIGVRIVMHARDSVRNLTIWNVTMGQTMSIDDNKLQKLTGSMIEAGDDIIIETTRRKKSAILRRKGRRTNILNCLKKPITWLQLQRGDNVFYYDADVGKLQMEFTIENQIIYEGM